jgi:PAS domain S-box-containing protein
MTERPSAPLLPWAIFAAFTVALALVGLYLYQAIRDTRHAEVEAGLKAIADLKTDQLASWLADRRDDLGYLGKDSLLGRDFDAWLRHGGQDAGRLATIRRHMETLVMAGIYDRVILYDAGGQPRLERGGSEVMAEHEAAVREAMRLGQPVLVDFHRDGNGPIMVGMVGPLTMAANGGDRIVGALYVGQRTETRLFPLLRKWPLPSQSGETVLARREGDQALLILTRKDPPMSRRIPLSSQDVPAVRALRGESGFMENARDYHGDPVLAYGLKVPGTPWVQVAKQDQSEGDASVHRAAWQVAGVLTLLLAGAGGTLGFWWRARESRYRHRILKQELNQAVAAQEAAEALAASDENYRILAEYSPDWAHWLGPDQRYRYVSPGCESVCGYPAADFLADPGLMARILHPEDLPTWKADLEETPDPLHPAHAPLALRIRTRAGEERWIEHVCRDVYGSDGQYRGRRGSYRDITAARQLEQERAQYRRQLEAEVDARTADLKASNGDLEAFAYSVSHDLRAPLRAIDGFVAILLEDYAPSLDAEGRRLFGIVQENARKMGGLIDDILAFSRASRLALEVATVDMNALVDEAWAGLAEARGKRAIEFRRADLPPVAGDPRALRQIWQNLLGNAVKFSRGREPAVIEVGGEAKDGLIWYWVRDNGAGFNPDYAAKLFGLFQRLHSQDEFEGTGVGLAVVKRFVDKHGGRVEAEGALDAGASFRFGLPETSPNPFEKRSDL